MSHDPPSRPKSKGTARSQVNRRRFIGSTTATFAAGVAAGASVVADSSLARSGSAQPSTAESLTRHLYETLSPRQREAMCFEWDHRDPKRGLLRTFVANNWNVSDAEIISDFYTDDQRQNIRDIFEAMIDPAWHERYDRQLDDDAGGFGHDQSVAIFGRPNDAGSPFQLVMTGRHMTLRCDGNSADHVAFGGPIFYGHAPEFNESASHPDNVFWSQAVAANGLYRMMDGKQQTMARVAKTPREQRVGFRGEQLRSIETGLPVTELSSDQKDELSRVVSKLVEPFRTSDRDEVMRCLKTTGGLDACRLSFYTDHDLGDDGVWDNWRLEGPSFVWHYRGAPHVHVWVNVADSADVPLNA